MDADQEQRLDRIRDYREDGQSLLAFEHDLGLRHQSGRWRAPNRLQLDRQTDFEGKWRVLRAGRTQPGLCQPEHAINRNKRPPRRSPEPRSIRVWSAGLVGIQVDPKI